MRTDYENTVYAIGALTVLIERDETLLTDRAAMIETRRNLLERVPRLLAELHGDALVPVPVLVMHIGAAR